MNRLVFAGEDLQEFQRALLAGAPLESAGAVIARSGHGNPDLRFVVIQTEVAGDVEYLERSPTSAILSPLFVARVLKIARNEKASLFLVTPIRPRTGRVSRMWMDAASAPWRRLFMRVRPRGHTDRWFSAGRVLPPAWWIAKVG